MGLLTAPPTPDGTHADELDVPGYERQSIDFGPPSNFSPGSSQRSTSRVSFGPIGHLAGDVGHAAIFNPDGTILGYAWVQTCAGYFGHGEVAFEVGRVSLRF